MFIFLNSLLLIKIKIFVIIYGNVFMLLLIGHLKQTDLLEEDLWKI